MIAWYTLCLVFLIIAVALETRLPLYALQYPLMVRLTLLAPVLYGLGIVTLIILIIQSSPVLVPIMLAVTFLIVRYLIFYGRAGDRFVDLDHANTSYHNFLGDEPEMAVVFPHQKVIQIVPTKILMVNDLVLTAGQGEQVTRYSLSFCALCNTIHAFVLPVIAGDVVEITSNRGMVINGNKILTDSTGRYIWQQFSGQPLSDPSLPMLEELHVLRLTWEQVKHRYPQAQYYREGVKPTSFVVFTLIRKAVRSLSFFGLSRGGRNNSLPRKELVVGVHIDQEAKAYPLSLFTEEYMIITDQLGATEFTLVHQGHGTVGFLETGLEIRDNLIVRQQQQWQLDGSALGDHADLEPLVLADQMYWYLWNQFYPNTTIYSTTP